MQEIWSHLGFARVVGVGSALEIVSIEEIVIREEVTDKSLFINRRRLQRCTEISRVSRRMVTQKLLLAGRALLRTANSPTTRPG